MDESQSAVSHHLRGLEKAGCFPFWHMLVYSRKNFIDYSKKCPGLKMLKRRYYTKEEILEWANNEYEMEKKYFLEMKKHNFNILIVYSFLSKDMIAYSILILPSILVTKKYNVHKQFNYKCQFNLY